MAAQLYASLLAVQLAGWGAGVELAPGLAVFGVLAGCLAASSRLRTLPAMLLLTIIACESALLAQALSVPATSWREQISPLYERLWAWYWAVARQGPTFDQVALSCAIGFSAVVLGFCSSWLVFRLQSGWLALVLNVTAGLLHLSYATVDSIAPFLVATFLGVLVVASLELHLRRADWLTVGAPVEGAAILWTLVSASAIAATALLIANQLPAGETNAELAARYDALTAPWRDAQKQVEKLVGGSRGQSRPGQGLAFAESLVPREEFELSQRPMLKIKAPQRRYWRAVTYDRYDGHSIAATPQGERHYGADQDLPSDPDGGLARAMVEQQVTVLADGANVLFAADTPLRVSVPLTVEEREAAWDLIDARFAAPLQRGQTYRVQSQVSQAGRRELAAASGALPQWTRRYLELPTSLPTRVGELANRLAASAGDPFERALRLEDHLRGLSYSTHTTSPPPDRDWVDFLLFDSGNGYCDYFATALTVLLRTQGIPARVASGFATGQFDDREQAWIVRESDAHSWTEAYFPGYGWITLEPSAIRPTPDRVESSRATSTTRSSPGSAPERLDEDPLDVGAGGASTGVTRAPAEWRPQGVFLVLASGILLLVGAGVLGMSWFWERGLEDAPPATRRYDQALRLLNLGGWKPPAGLTADELAAKVASDLPELGPAFGRLVRRYVTQTYSGSRRRELGDSQGDDAWPGLRRRLLATAVDRRLGRLTQRRS
jgi:transglutaminase-like putative cysteine protease